MTLSFFIEVFLSSSVKANMNTEKDVRGVHYILQEKRISVHMSVSLCGDKGLTLQLIYICN